jgi:hypothetical protein
MALSNNKYPYGWAGTIPWIPGDPDYNVVFEIDKGELWVQHKPTGYRKQVNLALAGTFADTHEQRKQQALEIELTYTAMDQAINWPYDV